MTYLSDFHFANLTFDTAQLRMWKYLQGMHTWGTPKCSNHLVAAFLQFGSQMLSTFILNCTIAVSFARCVPLLLLFSSQSLSKSACLWPSASIFCLLWLSVCRICSLFVPYPPCRVPFSCACLSLTSAIPHILLYPLLHSFAPCRLQNSFAVFFTVFANLVRWFSG